MLFTCFYMFLHLSRCSLITIITLTDHLHMTHFRAANVLATAVRKTLSPNHPLRRLLSIFTFGSIFVNLQAMHTLIGPRHVLHRSTPFVQFEDLSAVVPQNLLPLPLDPKNILFQRKGLDAKGGEAQGHAEDRGVEQVAFQGPRKSLLRGWQVALRHREESRCRASLL